MNRLDKIEARARNGALMHDIGPTSDREWALCATAIREDAPALVAALRAVLKIHQDGGESQGYTDTGTYGDMPHCCTECGSFGEYGVPYPCPTVAAIRQHLGEDA